MSKLHREQVEELAWELYPKSALDERRAFIKGKTVSLYDVDQAAFEIANGDGQYFDTIPEGSPYKEFYRRQAKRALEAAGLIMEGE